MLMIGKSIKCNCYQIVGMLMVIWYLFDWFEISTKLNEPIVGDNDEHDDNDYDYYTDNAAKWQSTSSASLSKSKSSLLVLPGFSSSA